MRYRKTTAGRVALYCLLFSASLLVFDSVTMLVGVMAALFALHFFTSGKWHKEPS